MKPALYVESTVPSYFVARPSRDVIALAHQQITQTWWERRLPVFEPYVSPIVLEEVARGEPELARRRLDLLSAYPVLEATPEAERLAGKYMRELGLPQKAIRDAAHLAFACAHGMDYLVTWNCAHIANAEINRRLIDVNLGTDFTTPIICTPEELMGPEEM